MSSPTLSIHITEPLLQSSSRIDIEEETWSLREISKEFFRLTRLSVPLAIQYLFAYISLVVSSVFCGHLGRNALAVVVLSTSLYNVLGASIMVGFSSAIETLCGMAYGGKNYAKMGILLQRALIVASSAFLVICCIWAFGEPLLLLAGQERELAAKAAHYLHLSIPALFFGGVVNCVLQRYLQSQGIVMPVTIAVGLIALLAPLYMAFFVDYLALGLYGAPIATGANNFSIAVALILITIWRESKLQGTEKQMWRGWSRRSFKGLWTYLKLALPSSGMICCEWWAFEVIVLFAGVLKDPQIAVSVMGICMNINSAVYSLARGTSGAASTRVSNELGAARPTYAKRAAWSAVVLGGISSGVLAVVCYLLRTLLIGIFTSDKDVLAISLEVFPIMCATIFTDGVNVSIEGVIRGSGRQMLAAVVNVVTYWGLGVTTAWVFAFDMNLRVMGFWYARLLATAAQMAVMLLVLALYKWEELAVYAAVSVAAATPKRSDAEVAHPVKSPAFFSQSPSEVAILLAACPESPADRTQSTAIDIAQPEEPSSGSEELTRTPVYSYTGHVTMGGSFAIH